MANFYIINVYLYIAFARGGTIVLEIQKIFTF